MKSLKKRFEELEERLKALDHRLKSKLKGKIYPMLVASECHLIQAYEHSMSGSGTPVPNIPCSPIGGYVELGPVLHWLNYPSAEWKDTVAFIVKVLEAIEEAPLPQSKIDPALYEKMRAQAEGEGIVARDGTIYGEHTYEQLDKGWLLSLFYFVYYEVLRHKVHPFVEAPHYKPIPLAPGAENRVKVAIVGDWGTGQYGDNGGPALAVIRAVESLNPDYIIHLGDVYYAGTQGFTIDPGEETKNFLDLWPRDRFGDGKKAGTSYTLNSNHEMYDGANGYFNIALLSNNTPFSRQQGHSYFALTFEDWIILGLDSAYFSSPESMFMTGSIGGADGAQSQWVKSHCGDLEDKKVIVMTHHQGIVETDSPDKPFKLANPLWGEISEVVGRAPDYWYWGHVHNGIVFAEDVGLETGNAKMRCAGHGAIPYALAWSLMQEPWSKGIAHVSQTPECSRGRRVRNGFAQITLGAGGFIEEAFFEVEDGTSEAIRVWPRS